MSTISPKVLFIEKDPESVLNGGGPITTNGNKNEYRDDESSDSDAASISPAATPATEAQQQRAKFQSWVNQRAIQLAKDEAKLLLARSNDDLDQSTQALVLFNEKANIIDKPRDYQMELFERAKAQNTIAVLDTGSGKTLIAVMLLRHILDKEHEDRAAGMTHRIAFFIVNCVTLVFQQAAVLECNLDVKMDRLCGDMGCSFWVKETWDKIFADNMVIVCTADVVYQCLMHGFLSIDQINLLIFDEAHHAKKNHAYARIIRDFYDNNSTSTRQPRIFGMTASPVDAKVSVQEASQELEALLHCQIATVSDPTLLSQACYRPEESVEYYNQAPLPFATPLLTKLEPLLKSLPAFSKLVDLSSRLAAQLGPWCADRIWANAFTEDELRKIESKAERERPTDQDEETTEVDAHTNETLFPQAEAIIKEHKFDEFINGDEAISSKVRVLKSILDEHFALPTASKCIVFVKERYTARLLSDLFMRIGSNHLRVDTLIGANVSEATGDSGVTFRKQILTVTKFRTGKVNCLFATTIAEEGLDIPDCNVVVRFDLYSTLIQYIQSRGRARRPNSKFIHMMEQDNFTHLRIHSHVHNGEIALKDFCSSLPEDRLLRGNEYDLISSCDGEDQFLEIKSTKARLTLDSSLTVLAHFVSTLPHDGEGQLTPTYYIVQRGLNYICEVQLPAPSPVISVTGDETVRKSLAKRSAAFKACTQLHKYGVLDVNLLSTFKKRLPSMRNAQLALSEKSKASYAKLTKPKFWLKDLGTPKTLYLFVFQLTQPKAFTHAFSPVGILTRRPVPDIPCFPLHIASKEASTLQTYSYKKALDISSIHLEQITQFTERYFQNLYNKEYENDNAKRAYWVVPIVDRAKLSSDSQPNELIDWPMLAKVAGVKKLSWDKTSPNEFFENKFFVDPLSGALRYFTSKVAPDLKATDPVPEGFRNIPRRGKPSSILEQSISMYGKNRDEYIARCDPTQPVIRAWKVNLKRNWLDNIGTREPMLGPECYICPEPLAVSPLPASLAATGFVFPSIMFRLDSYLIALEAFKKLGILATSEFALEALTKDSDNTHEHRMEQIHVQRGMGKNYERLEFLGDSFLKMAVSISIYAQHPGDDEYFLHVKRMTLICNKNLRGSVIDWKLYEYIRSSGFDRSQWYPENLKLLVGRGAGETREQPEHVLGDKTVADVAEAMIGAAYLYSKDHKSFDNVVKAVSKLVSTDEHAMETWAEYYQLYKKPQFQKVKATASQLYLARQLEKIDDYHFQYPRLVRCAFSHPSYPFIYEEIPSYQRLEFLGDALYDMVCVDWLYDRYPDKDPQWLTEHKSAMVSNRFQGMLSVSLGFHKHLRFSGDFVRKQIFEYVQDLTEAKESANGALDFWVHMRSPPKALPDILEAYIGAVFVDSKFDYVQIERFFKRHILPYFEDMEIYDTFANNHPTTLLHSRLTHSYRCANYRLFAAEGLPALPGTSAKMIAAVMIHGKVIAEGQAESGKNAKVAASKNALTVLETMTVSRFRVEYNCNCKIEEDEEAAIRIEDRASAI